MDNYYYIYFKIIYKYILPVLICGHVCVAQQQQEIQVANEYYLRGEKAKALAAFQQLAKDPQNSSAIHANYLSLLLDVGNFKQAEEYVDRLIRKDDRITYKLDLGLVYLRAGDVGKADKYLKSIIKAQTEDVYRAKTIADYLTSRNLIEYSIYALKSAREASKNPSIFFLELANLYRLQGKRDEMVEEYLEYVTQTPANTGYVKNLLQILLTKPDELESLEKLLTDRVQVNPSSEVFIDLLIWTQLQQKNFYGAFVQARAYDKRFRKDQSKTLEIAQIALNNQDYMNADKAFTYVVKEFANTENYLPAQLGLIKAREAKVKKNYPVSTDSVVYLIEEYTKFCLRYPMHPSAYEARLNQALLFAHYLDKPDSATVRIHQLIADTKTPPTLRNQAKIDLGDIYLLKGEPWESTLLYSQVEKSQRETPLGYEAKLRNAKLSYYKGDFKLAQEHLDILKQATTREIANDAMDLSMRIKENLGFDTLGTAMKLFASADLDLLQNKSQSAIEKLDQLEKDFPNHSLTDDIWWLKANLLMKKGDFNTALALLQNICDKYGDDVLADDAAFMQAEIYEQRLHQKEKAKELYRTFLDTYPGSVFAAEARKRYRMLRGDFEEKPVN